MYRNFSMSNLHGHAKPYHLHKPNMYSSTVVCAQHTCRQQVEKKTVLENLDQVMLAMDEIVDGGCVFVSMLKVCLPAQALNSKAACYMLSLPDN